MSQRETLPPPSRLPRLNTLPQATPGRRLTAIMLALLSGPIAGLLCIWLANSVLAGTSPWLQVVVFAAVGFVIGATVLAGLAAVDARTRD